jgi:hypothetical protein
MDKMKKMAPDLSAKKDVLMALKKLAMQMMSEDPEGQDGAVVARVQMGKLGSKEDQMHRGAEALRGPDMEKCEMEDESEEDSEGMESEDEEMEDEEAPAAKAAKKLFK